MNKREGMFLNFEERTEKKLCEHDERLRDLEIKEASQTNVLPLYAKNLKSLQKQSIAGWPLLRLSSGRFLGRQEGL